jgi:uncharacterized protein YjlB
VSKKKKKNGPAGGLVGLGFDAKDGHKRITTSEQFAILGGSDETHGRMTETAIKTFEELKARRKQINQVDPQELAEIIDKSTPR